MKKEQYKARLVDMLKDMPELLSGYDQEIIYTIDGLNIYGAFDCGSRGIDHNILLFNGVTWCDILEWGYVVVPETEAYISENPVSMFDNLGYERLPLNNNHIMGYK